MVKDGQIESMDVDGDDATVTTLDHRVLGAQARGPAPLVESFAVTLTSSGWSGVRASDWTGSHSG